MCPSILIWEMRAIRARARVSWTLEHPMEIYALIRDDTDGIFYNVFGEGGLWGDWISIPGVTKERVAGVMYNDDLHLAIRGTTGGIYHGYLDLDTDVFSGWTKLSGDTPSPPVLTASEDSLFLVVRGNNDKVYYSSYSGSWSGWTGLPGATMNAPSATMLGDDLHIVVRGTNGMMYHGYVVTPMKTFSGWSKMSGSTPSTPILTDDETSVYLVVRGSNDKVYYNVWDGVWDGWTGLPGSTSLSPGASVMEGDLHIVIKGAIGGLYHGWVTIETDVFSGWTLMIGDTPSPPTLVAN